MIKGKPEDFEACWEIAARVARHTLGTGDVLEIRIYYCGAGIPDWAKVSFYPPLGVLRPRREPNTGEPGGGTIEIHHAFATGVPMDVDSRNIPDGTRVAAIADDYTIFADEYGGNSPVPMAYFFPLLVTDKPGGSSDFADAVVDWGRRSVAEVDSSIRLPDSPDPHEPPTKVSAIISRAAKGGDYSIPFVLTYSTKAKVKSSTFRLDFHVKWFWERAWFQAVVVGSAAVALAAGGLTVWTLLLGRIP